MIGSGKDFCLMEPVPRDVDRAKRRGRNSVIKLVLGSPDEGAKRRNPGESSVSLDSASLHPGYILRGLFLGQYTRR